MSFKKRFLFFIVGIALAILTINLLVPAEAKAKTENDRILAAVKSWVIGRYDSSEQVKRDLEAEIPDNMQHRLMHQVFFPVEVPFLDGVVIYQQSSIDGSDDPDWIIRRGLLHFFVSPETGMVHQRELSFKNEEDIYNIHQDPSRLDGLTLEDLTWSEDCDFKLTMEEGGNAVSGPMDFGPCRIFNDGVGKDMIAQDKIRITPREFWFLGRYVDEDGNVMWGTENDEMNKLKRISGLGEEG